MRFELFIASRYLLDKWQAFVRIIAGISIVGAAGLASLVVAMAMTNGFRQDLQHGLFGSTSHIRLQRVADDEIKNWRSLMASRSSTACRCRRQFLNKYWSHTKSDETRVAQPWESSGDVEALSRGCRVRERRNQIDYLMERNSDVHSVLNTKTSFANDERRFPRSIDDGTGPKKGKAKKGAVMNLPLNLSDVKKQVTRAFAIVLFIAMIALYVYIWSLHHWVM